MITMLMICSYTDEENDLVRYYVIKLVSLKQRNLQMLLNYLILN